MTGELINHRVEEMPDTEGDRRFSVVADFADGVCEPFGVTITDEKTEFEANWMAANPDYLKELEDFMIERKIHLHAKRRRAVSTLKPSNYDLESATKAFIEAHRINKSEKV